MSIALSIPDAVVEAIRLPEEQVEPELLKALAVALYQRGYLSFGKARELAGLGKLEFARLLEVSGVQRHYTAAELEDDIAYARGQ